MEFPTINDNIVYEEATLVVVSHEHEHMSLARYHASLFWETFFLVVESNDTNQNIFFNCIPLFVPWN